MGITVRNQSGIDWSFGLGGVVDELREEERGAELSAFYTRIKWDAGFFLHRNGSLLASVQVSESWTQRFRLNVYPGVRDDDFILGISVMPAPLGLAASRS